MKELSIEEIKKANKEIYEKMKEISIGVINVRGELYELARKSSVMWDALWELGYSVYKGEMSIKDAKERLMKYRSYIYMSRMLCMMKGKRFNEKKEVLDIDVFDIPVTKK